MGTFGSEAAATRSLARYVSDTRYSDLPQRVRHEALRAFVNFVGCAIGGSTHPVVSTLERTLCAFSGQPEASIIGRRVKYDLLLGCLLNAASASAHAFDDTHSEAMVHPSGVIAPSILGIAERDHLSGSDFIHAFALGVEVTCRLSKAISVAPARAGLAWIQTGITGCVGAALAAGKLLNLTPAQLECAIGIAIAQAAGVRVVHGSMCTSFIPANAAQSGLRAALLAAQGFTSSPAALEGRFGFFEAFAEQIHLPSLIDDLGNRFEILGNTYKPFPCGVVIHPIIECCLRLKSDHQLDPLLIDEVIVRMNPAAMAITDRPNPRDSLEAQVSFQHWTAVALASGAARLQEASPGSIESPANADLRKRVRGVADPQITADGAEVRIAIRGGDILRQSVTHYVGSAARPMSDADLERKFYDQAENILSAPKAEKLLAACWGIGELEHIGEIGQLSFPVNSFVGDGAVPSA